MTCDLMGKTVVVTGATSGIGLAAVRKLVRAGASVIGVGRSAERNTAARESVLAEYPDGRLIYLLADLASQAQVRRLAKEIKSLLEKQGFRQLDVLVNNAGAYREKKSMTEDGIEKTFAVNHLASFLLTHELLSWLRQSGQGRVLTVSSYSHKTTWLCPGRIADPWPYIGLLAYKRSKLSNVLFVYELNRRFDDLAAFAVDPGLVNTDIASKGGVGISDWVWRSRRKKGTSADVPAETILFLACEEAIDTSQGYYFKNSAPLPPSRKAQRADLAAKLWALSGKLTCLEKY